MVFFQSSGTRQRHRFIDDSIDNYTTILDRNNRENGHIPEVKVADLGMKVYNQLPDDTPRHKSLIEEDI
jgi:hypothetical protein